VRRDHPDVIEVQADSQRYRRVGIPEAIYCPGKTLEQIRLMCQGLRQGKGPIIMTKIARPMAKALVKEFKDAQYHPKANLLFMPSQKNQAPAPSSRKGGILSILSGGTTDIPVAEEAALTAELLGTSTQRFYDVGVAGLHRLLGVQNKLQASSCVIVAAGMEGALASVVGGLVPCPVIALPTSVGYGTGQGGWAALLSMLNSCAPNVCVVNIDDGFGAGVIAHLISKR